MTQSQWQTIEHLLGQMNDAEKRALIARVTSSLSVEPTQEELLIQRKALDELRVEMDSLPMQNPADGFCSSDHDRILYGGPT